jgi:hypothetical protein
MLNITSNIKDRLWLEYIVSEFVRSTNAKFEVTFSRPDEDVETKNCITYGFSQEHAVSIPHMGKIKNGEFDWKSNDFFILKNSEIEGSEYTFTYDLFWNAFFHISRIEEWEQEAGGKRILSYSKKHPRIDKKTFNYPIVNSYFEKLKSTLLIHFPDLAFKDPVPSVVEWSHDLDYITKSIQLRIKQTIFNSFNTAKSIGKKSFLYNLKRTVSFLFSNPSYWCFDYWQDIEKKHQVTSTFFIYSKQQLNGGLLTSIRRWLIDPSYNVLENTQLQKKLIKLHFEGWDIGVHGSYDSANNKSIFNQELHSLSSVLRIEIKKGRQHWLNFSESKTSKIHSKSIARDYTIGWNDQVGFRAGIASPFVPFDHENNQPFNHLVIPQVIMDSHIFDYKIGQEKALDIFEKALDKENAYFSVSWHPRTCSSDYNWHFVYESLLKKYQGYLSQ